MRDVFNSKPKSHQGQGQIWREAHAELIDQLGAAKAKTIAQTAFFFEAQTGRGLMYQMANQPAPSVRAPRPELPQELADILDKTLSKSPAQRYQTGGELAADLHRAIAFLSPSTDAGRAPDNTSAPTGQDDENAMLATVVTPAPVSSTVPERAGADIRL